MLPHEAVCLSSSCWCWKAKIRIDAIHSSGIFMRTHFCHNSTSAWQRHSPNVCNSNWRLHISTGNIAQPTQMLCCQTIKIPLCVPFAVLLLCLMGWKDVSAAVQRQQIAIANINAFRLKHTNLRVLAGRLSVCVCVCVCVEHTRVKRQTIDCFHPLMKWNLFFPRFAWLRISPLPSAHKLNKYAFLCGCVENGYTCSSSRHIIHSFSFVAFFHRRSRIVR